jgi:hypothetical protein
MRTKVRPIGAGDALRSNSHTPRARSAARSTFAAPGTKWNDRSSTEASGSPSLNGCHDQVGAAPPTAERTPCHTPMAVPV